MQRASLDFWENYLETMLFLSILLNNVWSASSAKSRNALCADIILLRKIDVHVIPHPILLILDYSQKFTAFHLHITNTEHHLSAAYKTATSSTSNFHSRLLTGHDSRVNSAITCHRVPQYVVIIIVSVFN